MKKLIFDFIEKNKISERDAKSDSKDRRQENRYNSRNLEYIQVWQDFVCQWQKREDFEGCRKERKEERL